MTNTPDGPDGADQAAGTEPEDGTESNTAAEPKAAADRASRRERWLRLALLTVGAALVASIFSILSQRSDDDPVAAGERTAEASSGVVAVDIDVVEDGLAQEVTIGTRFDGDDYATTISSAADAEAYPDGSFDQEVRLVDGVVHYWSNDVEAWETIDDTSIVVLDDAVPLPDRVLGWSGEGSSELIAALGLPDELDGAEVSGSLTVAEARALADRPIAVEVIVDDGWEWGDDQVITVTVALDDGRLQRMEAAAVDDADDRADGPLSVSTVTTYRDLGADMAIQSP